VRLLNKSGDSNSSCCLPYSKSFFNYLFLLYRQIETTIKAIKAKNRTTQMTAILVGSMKDSMLDLVVVGVGLSSCYSIIIEVFEI